MKYFYYENMPNYVSRFGFVIRYEIKDNKIIVNYANGYTTQEENTNENLKSIVEAIKNQVLGVITEEDQKRMHKAIKSDNFWIGYNAWFTFYTLYNSFTATNGFNKGFQRDEIQKYRYFLENEDIINYEIIKRYFEEEPNSPDISNAPLITINDISNMPLTELKETVDKTKKHYLVLFIVSLII